MGPYTDKIPAHPGFIIREKLLPGVGMSPAELARALGVNKTNIHYILHGRNAVTASTAVRLAALFGVPATRWLELQQRYDIAMAERALAAELEQIESLSETGSDLAELLK